MKKHLKIKSTILLSIIFAVLTSGCDKTNTIPNQTPQSQRSKTNEYRSNYIYIKDVTNYEESFVDGLINYSIGQKVPTQLLEDLLIVGKEKYLLPSEIEAGKQYFFSREKKVYC